MSFNVISFLDEYRIPYVDRGANVARGNVYIQCPWCGDSDPSQHMGIEVEKGWYACWRDGDHRGKNPTRLIRALLGCSLAEAAAIAGRSGVGVSDFEAFVTNPFGIMDQQADEEPDCEIEFPKDFRPMGANDFSDKAHMSYLCSRGFTYEEACDVCTIYNLHFAVTGRWKGRIIIPITYNWNLVSWTSRTIWPDEKKRYMSLTANMEKAKERGDPVGGESVNRLVWQYDFLMDTGSRNNKQDLYICEGPFDAIKVDYFLSTKPIPSYATCIFTLTITDEQKSLLTDLSEYYNLYIMLDSTAHHNALKLQRKLVELKPQIVQLPTGFKDPGELTSKELGKLMGGLFCNGENSNSSLGLRDQ